MGVTPGGAAGAEPCGVVVVDKPAGITSHDVVADLRRVYGTRRVGHAGTLDPMATGVLAVCVGPATRIAEYLAATGKEYVAGFVFGLETDTEDTTGTETARRDASALTETVVRNALETFVGEIEQVPPMVSAVHHQGRRLYELAREGKHVERAPRPVRIHEIALESFATGELARATVRVRCSSGTYIRTLAADVGRRLGTGGAMERLCRTRVGGLSLDEAHTPAALAAMREAGAERGALRPIAAALTGWPMFRLDEPTLCRIAHGQPTAAPDSGADEGALAVALDAQGCAVAICRVTAGMLHPHRVFVRPSQRPSAPD